MKLLLKIIKEHINYRNQILKLAKADLIKTYRGATLGWTWAIIKPVVNIFVYWFAIVIGLRAGKDVNGYPFFLWLVSGMIPWFYMNQMITDASECIIRYDYLVTKMKFPVATIPTFVNISRLIIHIILIGLTIMLFAILGHIPDIYLLQLPVYILLTFLFFNIWGLFSAPLGAISKDYVNLIKSLVLAVFLLSGIVWNPSTVENEFLKNILKLNPITFLIEGYRNCFINKVWFWQEPKKLLYFVIITTILLIIAIRNYKKLRKEIPDVL